ncbi:DUF4376 domain-containing protein [Burkholderia plantarii]|uniref:DUF4376 domain-containing protein n=1 Tax=Burkholderia plantarii TaxID=41899 RepID=A0A0B6RVY8_BURPL|nr:DUF4376 domain-containing protein [Burkholderia plantarii]AJK46304.1 hypothetical protein BGL_1c17950 [Burkholderia plantarii]
MMTDQAITFAQMGFASTVTAASAAPEIDGYYGTYCSFPYHIHPTATPDVFAALEAAITADQVTATLYVAPSISLDQARVAQKSAIDVAYQSAIVQPVSFKTSGGVVETFDADIESQTALMKAAQGYALIGAVPAGFYWVSTSNEQVPFALADLEGLYQVILAQGWAAMQKRQNLKMEIVAAATVADVQSIVWE